MPPLAGKKMTVDDYVGTLNTHSDEIAALQAEVAPVDGRLDSLETVLNAFLGNVRSGAVIDSVGGDARVHCEFDAPFEDGEIPVVTASFGDFTGLFLGPFVIHSSVDEDGFDVAVFHATDDPGSAWVAGDAATGHMVRINYHAITPSLIS